ncbi:MAG TPA: preprotein translocase subunit SecG [Halieaceae bacterium]|jgi:preprotein translocase subunit SecG|nr:MULTISPECIES: preprotein translocase subunit SecG [Haliea]HAN68454.1 preprotein translocase subunit SecG [Halieaceae bacterium]MAA87619.1 preprotein translocase subunit SecG [Haliea sp.]MAD64573.1 preprotein translocase subunit SecG [Haliea sp.]MAY93071.1 preprotein translocase subunit SecG [Haliea sp.]MBK39726.1 preprotein translocase subunit SecG [Haliea sp.]|tara:strand:+ start:1708 stop:2079 length:372 start_codon:yes stop_codon:yes gene_type:complete
MEQIILIVHLLIALAIIGLIMLQQGKGADVGASFGAGASQTLFGSAGSSNVLTKSTAWLVVLFFATSFGLAMLASQKTQVVDDLDLVIPAAEERMAPVLDSDLPTVDNAEPAAEAAAGDVPEL